MEPSEESIHLKAEVPCIDTRDSWCWIPAVESRLLEKIYCIGDLWGEGAVMKISCLEMLNNAKCFGDVFNVLREKLRKLSKNIQFTIPSLQMCAIRQSLTEAEGSPVLCSFAS